MNLIPITPSLGAEVEGLDLTQPLSSEQVRALQSAFETHQVLVFRDQVLADEEELLDISTSRQLQTVNKRQLEADVYRLTPH